MFRAGAGIIVADLMLRLKARGWDVTMLSMLPDNEFAEKLAGAAIPVDYLGMRRGVADPRAIFKASSQLGKWKPDILHSHTVHANLLARAVRVIRHVPVVLCTAHNINEGARWREVAYRLTDPLCDLTTNVSQAAADRYIRDGITPAHKMVMLPNGVDTARFRFDVAMRARFRRDLVVEEQFVWMAIGRIEEPKDYSNLISAFAQVCNHPARPSLLIVGDGNLREQLEQQIIQLGVDSQVQLLGVRSDVSDLLSAADGYVMSSAWEGMPLALLEASSVGLPIVATDVGGNREVVVDGATGFLVPSRNPTTLAEKMKTVMDLTVQARKQMGDAARSRIEACYDLERIVDLWEDLYIQLLTKKGQLETLNSGGKESIEC